MVDIILLDSYVLSVDNQKNVFYVAPLATTSIEVSRIV